MLMRFAIYVNLGIGFMRDGVTVTAPRPFAWGHARNNRDCHKKRPQKRWICVGIGPKWLSVDRIGL